MLFYLLKYFFGSYITTRIDTVTSGLHSNYSWYKVELDSTMGVEILVNY